MKRLMLIIVFLFTLSIPAISKDLICSWDAVATGTWDEVRIYERSGTSMYIYQQVSLVSGDLTSARIINVDLTKPHTYVARGYLNGNYSVDSNAISIGGTTIIVPAPKAFKVVEAP